MERGSSPAANFVGDGARSFSVLNIAANLIGDGARGFSVLNIAVTAGAGSAALMVVVVVVWGVYYIGVWGKGWFEEDEIRSFWVVDPACSVRACNHNALVNHCWYLVGNTFFLSV